MKHDFQILLRSGLLGAWEMLTCTFQYVDVFQSNMFENVHVLKLRAGTYDYVLLYMAIYIERERPGCLEIWKYGKHSNAYCKICICLV